MELCNIKKVNIILGVKEEDTDFEKNNDNTYTYKLPLKYILEKISDFSSLPESIENKSDFINEAGDIEKPKEEMKKIKEKYGKEFDSYLCAYLLYYLSEAIIVKFSNKLSSKEIKEVNFSNKKEIKTDIINIVFSYTGIDTFYIDSDEFVNKLIVKSKNDYNINYDIIYEILKKLLSDKPIENVSFN